MSNGDADSSGSAQIESDLVSDNLRKIGAISVEEFLSSISDALQSQDPEAMHNLLPKRQDSKLTPASSSNDTKSGTASTTNTVLKPLTRLHQTCQHRFGGTEALKFEYIEEDGACSKRCILTITRPNGATRCYTTQPVFSRKADAKNHVAEIAVDMGAIDFILTGDQGNYKGKKGYPILAPLDTPARQKSDPAVRTLTTFNEKNAPIIEIEECCRQWRAGLVKAHWVALHDRKIGNKHGTALRIQLSPHSHKVYSTGLAFNNPLEAKRACAKLAIEQGVLDFIKFGNGQTQPAVSGDDQEGESSGLGANVDPPASVLTLQEYYEALPRPFPEPFNDKTAVEINAPAWLNVMIQSARGGKLTSTFIWMSDNRNGLYGCLLRIERSGENSKSYLVDTRFSKRADAKAAVCLQAMSEGIGNYIRTISSAIESKVTPEMRKYVTERVYPLLASEYAKFRPGTHPSYEYQRDRGAFGCTMKVILSPAPAMDDIRLFNVPTEYRTKADAKAAVTLSAVQQGIIELLQFPGKPLPPGFAPFSTPFEEKAGDEPVSRKRHEPDQDGQESQNQLRKKRRKNDHKHKHREVDVASTHVDGNKDHMARLNPRAKPNKLGFRHGNHKPHGNDNRSWKQPHVPGSGGPESLSDTASASHPMDQSRTGSRYEGGSNMPSRGHPTYALPAHVHVSRPKPGSPTPTSAQLHYVSLGHGGSQVPLQPFEPTPPAPFQGGGYAAQTPSGHGAGRSVPAHSIPYYTDRDLEVASTSNMGHTPPYEGYPERFPSTSYSDSQHAQYHSSSVPARNYRTLHPMSGRNAGSQLSMADKDNISNHTPSGLQSSSQSDRVFGTARGGTGPGSQFSHPSYMLAERVDDSERSDLAHYRNGGNDLHVILQENPQAKGQRRSITNDAPPRKNIDTVMPGHESRAAAAGGVHVGEKNANATQSVLYGNPKPNTIASDAMQQPGNKGRVMQTPRLGPRSHVQALMDFCDEQGKPRPQFHHSIVVDEQGTAAGATTGSNNDLHKVWVVMGSERLELPVTFSTVTEGEERVAKQVLNRLRSGTKNSGKEKEKL